MSIMRKLGLIALALSVILISAAFAQEQAAADAAKTPAPVSLPALQPDARGVLSQQQMQQLFRVVADKDIENDKRLRDYTYIERDEEHKLDGKGQVKSTDVKTYEV